MGRLLISSIINQKEIQIMQGAPESQPQEKEQECSICYCASNKPVQCRGPCHKLFCLKCAAKAKTYSDRCPNRCSAPFEVELLPSPKLFCPYKPKQCTVQIATQKDLSQHYKVCPLVSQEQRQWAENRVNYKCKKGHSLTFLTHSGLQIIYGRRVYQTLTRCSECQQNQICRAICITCSISFSLDHYCSNCRPHPCSKSYCPLGHKIKHRSNPGKQRYCDFCDVPAGLLGRKVHGFCPCDFDICDLCFQKLPEKREKVALKLNPEKQWQLTMLINSDSQDTEYRKN